MGFNLQDYEPVADRLARFWSDHPDGKITTEIMSRQDGEVVVRAEVWIAERLVASGHAHEVVTQRGVNSTSAVENCETSAVGRALANANYAPKGMQARPSREEMAKVQRSERQPAARDRIDAARALIGDDEGRIAWAKATLTWPWTDDDCAQVEARYGSGTEAF